MGGRGGWWRMTDKIDLLVLLRVEFVQKKKWLILETWFRQRQCLLAKIKPWFLT